MARVSQGVVITGNSIVHKDISVDAGIGSAKKKMAPNEILIIRTKTHIYFAEQKMFFILNIIFGGSKG